MSLLDMRPRGAGGGSGAPADATFITQTPNVTLTNEQALSLLATGLLKNTTGTGVLSIGAAGTDYLAPAAIGVTVQAWDTDLDTLAGLAKADGNFIVGDGAAWVVESGATARTSLGLGSLAVINSPLPIANGGSGQTAQQAAIDVLTNVVAATNEHVLTKDTATGNAIFKAAAGGTTLPVADTQTIIKGSADATKLLRFEVDGFTAGATRVLTPPNADATIAGLEVANIFTAAQTVQVSSASALLVQDGATNVSVLLVNTATDRGSVFSRGRFVAGNGTNRIGSFQASDNANAQFTRNAYWTGSQWNREDTSSYTVLNQLLGNTTIGEFQIYTAAPAANPVGNYILRFAVDSDGFCDVIQVNANSAAITNALIVHRNPTSGTPAAGYGLALAFQGKSSTTNDQDMARITVEWATATHASRAARSKWTVYDTAEREGIRIEASGTAPMLGFLGASAIARPSTYTLAATATRTMPTPEAAFTGQDNAQAGAVYAKSADLITLQTRLDSVEGVLRQLIIDLASTSGYGLLVAS